MVSSTRENSPSAAGLWLLLAASLVVATLSLLTSFRVPIETFDVPWRANAARMLAAAAAGAAFGVSGALRTGGARPLREAYIFALSAGGAVGLAAGMKLIGGIGASLTLGVVGALTSIGLVWLADGHRRGLNGLLGAVLFALLTLGAIGLLAAGTERDGLGAAVVWLLGDVSRASPGGAISAALLVADLCAWWGMSERRTPGSGQSAAALLFGAGVGIAGPIAFLGWFAPNLVAAFSRPPRERIALCAAVGASLLMAADALPRALLGGYAPSLNIGIATVAIPAFLWWNRRRLRLESAPKSGSAFEIVEAGAIVVAALATAVVAYALVDFARSAT